LTRTILVCLLFSLSYQKETQKNDTASLHSSYPNGDQEEYLLRSRRSNKLPHRTTFKTEIGITKRLLDAFNGDKKRADKWVQSKVEDANRIFKESSLDTKLTIEVVNMGKLKIIEENMEEVSSAQIKRYDDKYLGKKYPLGIFGLSPSPISSRGLAQRETACNIVYSGIRSYIMATSPNNESGTLLAHEIGHVIGMKHNDETPCRAVGGGVMNKHTPSGAKQWTSCNNKDMKKYYEDLGKWACL